MADPRLAKLADILVNYSVAVKPGDLVLINGSGSSETAIVACYRAALLAGGQPWVRMLPEDCEEILLRHGNANQLNQAHPYDRHLVEQTQARITLWSERNTRSLTTVDPARQAARSQARAPLMKIFFERTAKPEGDPNRLRWSAAPVPTHAMAQDAEMSLTEYEDFVFGAGKLDQPNPVESWKQLGLAQQRLIDRLSKGRELHITAPNGTDIRFGIQGRTWINCDGHKNFPDGEVFTGPIEDATEGRVCFSFPAIEGGREVDGVRLTFRGGRVVEATADKNEAFLHRMLDQDAGARIAGELALGTNFDIRQFTRNTLFDEKIGGTFHMALGAAYPESGGKNQSGLHWDMVCDLRTGGEVRLDGEVIQRGGIFTNEAWPQPAKS